jgi:hypothetical protein
MRPTTLPMAVVLAALLGLVVAAPVGAATTGTVCGQVTAFTAPTAATDGSITIDGTTEVIDSSAFGVIDASVLVILSAIAAADATTCLEIVADGDGAIVDLSIAAQAEICGEVTLDTTTGAFSVAGVLLPTSIVSADAELTALLNAAAAADATVCVDVTIDGTTGLITTVSLNATITLCGDVTLDADSVTIGGVDVPLTLLDAEALAVLRLAVEADASVCFQLVVDDTDLVEANLSADITVCGEVTLDAEGNAVIDGVTIDADLLTAGAEALLELAATADGEACATVVAVSSNGDTTVTVGVTIEVCAEVTAIGDGTITLDGVTLTFAGAADSDIEVGDVICVAAATGPTGDPTVTDPDTTDGAGPGDDDGAGPGDDGAAPGDDDDDVALPDTAVGTPADLVGTGAFLVLLAALGAFVTRRLEDGSAG